MDIFISWSGDRSRALAVEIATWLKNVVHFFDPWISDSDLRKGDRWLQVVATKLSKCEAAIVCVTPENLDSQWLHFEAGAIAKSMTRSRVCPVLLGMDPSKLEGPLSQFQATVFSSSDMLKLVKSLNQELGSDKLMPDVLERSFKKYWPDLKKKTEDVAKMGICSTNLKSVVSSLQARVPAPIIGRVVYFNEGFESHFLYETVCQEARHRLYIFGRKNRKLFDKDHLDFFKKLKDVLSKGFDFRCLFLDPSAPRDVLYAASPDPEFPAQLAHCLKNASRILLDHGIEPGSVCRTYRTYRHAASIIVDRAVIFTPVEAALARGGHLTKCSFEVADVDIRLAGGLLDSFLETWEQATPLSGV